MVKVVTVVVTYNRKDLLKECLTAVFSQQYPVSKLILINNASTDGTVELLESEGFLNDERLTLVTLEKNLGGAGGFSKGLDLAKDEDCDWIWVMDDDSIPTENCLAELIRASEIADDANRNNTHALFKPRKRAFFASVLYGEKYDFMNLPKGSTGKAENGSQYWYRFLSDGMISIDRATFVSIMFSKEAVLKCGLPFADYFIWGDDYEYTWRLSRYYGDGYYVGKSVCIHKRSGCGLNISKENDPQRIKNYYYFYRNNAINERIYAGNRGEKLFSLLHKWLKFLKQKKGLLKANTFLRGTLAAKFQYKKYKNEIEAMTHGEDIR